MLRLEWVEEQLDRIKHDTCTMQNVRDYAALVIARDSLRGEGKTPSPVSNGPDVLDETPTLEQAEKVLGAVVVNSDEERKRVKDAMTWARILKGEG